MNEEKKVDIGDFKSSLYQSFKGNGILDSLKAQMRSKIFETLKKKNTDGRGADALSVKAKLQEKDNNLNYKICISIINDFLKKNELAYSMSVLIPESGLGSQTLSKAELEEVLKLKAERLDPDDESAPLKKLSSPLLQDLVEAMKRGQSIRPNQATCSVQTDEGEEGLTLDEKLKRLDLKFMEATTAERVMPYKVLEERMIKYKRECDERARKEIQTEVAKVREIEIAHVRLEEAAAYRAKIAEFRNELDSMHKDKIKELKQRESEVIERCKYKDREIEAAAFEHRQQVLKDLEMLRLKEQEMKKTVEMELIIIKNEREKLFQKEKEADLKLKDLNLLKLAYEKKVNTEIEEFKRKFESDREEEKRIIQSRRMKLEEEEHRFELNREKFLHTENEKIETEKERISLEYDKLESDFNDLKLQLKEAQEQLLKDAQIIASKTIICETLEKESKTLKELLESQKEQFRNEKDTNREMLDNLKNQLREQKDLANQIKQKYDNEIQGIMSENQRDRENFKNMYKMEEHKLRYEIDHLNRKMECEQHLSKELTLVNDKLMREQSNLRNKYQIDEIQRDAYVRGDTASHGVRPSDFLTMNGIPIVTGLTDTTLGEEYLARQKAWNDLDNETRDVKRNINKIGLVTIPERIYQPTYNIENHQTPFDNESSDGNDRQERFNSYSPLKEEKKEETKSVADQNKKIKDSQKLRDIMAMHDKESEEAELKAKRDNEQRRKEADEQQRKDKEKREKEIKDKERRDKELKDKELKDKELKDKEKREKERLDNIKKENERKEKERKDKEQKQKEEEQKKAAPAQTSGSSGI